MTREILCRRLLQRFYACRKGIRPTFKLFQQRQCSSLAMTTADLCDEYGDELQYVETQFKDYGGVKKFHGQISTVKCYEDNSLVKKALSEAGSGKVLVVDGAGSYKRALLGDNVAASALKNGWNGVVINGCIRDSELVSKMEIGVKALGTSPRKTEKIGQGQKDVKLQFGGAIFTPGQYLYADADGIVVSDKKLQHSKL